MFAKAFAAKINILLETTKPWQPKWEMKESAFRKFSVGEFIAKTTYDYYQKVIDGFVKEKA